VLLWFAGASVVIVWSVFQSPAIDYRMVVLGSVLPLADAVSGRAAVLHTLSASVLVLGVVMLATRGRRLVRRRWIGLPIGMMLHLALDGIWARAEVFWWPFFGVAFPPEQVPELMRGIAAPVVLEAIGAACLVWVWSRFGLADPDRRNALLRTGQLDRKLAR
jgi:hypothetical protein